MAPRVQTQPVIGFGLPCRTPVPCSVLPATRVLSGIRRIQRSPITCSAQGEPASPLPVTNTAAQPLTPPHPQEQQHIAAPPTVTVAQTKDVDDLLTSFKQEQETEEVPLRQAAQEFLQYTPAGKAVTYGGSFALLLTAVVTTARISRKYTHPAAKKVRTTNKNKELVMELAQFLPDNRAGLTPGKMGMLRVSTGYTPVEMFRKYLWFALRERPFNQTVVDDLIHLAGVLQLSPPQVAQALKERAHRVEQRYGTIMLDLDGMTQEGMNRKVAGRALFSKLLYLTECEELLPASAAQECNLRDVFGATEDEVAALRIVSLVEVDLDRLGSLPTTDEGSDA